MKARLLILAISILLGLSSHAQTELWGMTSKGGEYNKGTIFKTDKNGNSQKVVHFFESVDAKEPHGDLIEASNGNLYGMTSEGGRYNLGTLIEYNISTNNVIKILDFDGINKGATPYGNLFQASNGKLYGLTYEGGTKNRGVLFEYDIANKAYSRKINFGGGNKGENPRGSLIEVSNGKLYGMTSMGGTNGFGIIFEYDFITNTFSKKVDFDNTTKGSSPYGSLIKASNGKLYGITYGGGVHSKGAIFEYDYVNNIFAKKKDFDGSIFGAYPYGSLIQASNDKLYGMTSSGGVNNLGVFFEFNITFNSLKILKDFDETDKGKKPYGNLLQAKNGKLYGITSQRGDRVDPGVIFEYDIYTKVYNKKIEFGVNNNIRRPWGSLMQASNGKLYAMEGEIIFEYSINSNSISNEVSIYGTFNGSIPYGSLLQASNGKLYGMTSEGGIERNRGVLFEYNISTNTLMKKIDFEEKINGRNPYGSLIQAKNGKIYGTTLNGGLYSYGVLFEYDLTTNELKKLLNFEKNSNGEKPYGRLLQANNGKLYGMTSFGGLNNKGVLFEFDLSSNTFTKKIEFDGSNIGKNPKGSLIQAKNGKLYGMTTYGGSYNAGVLFEYDINTNNISIKVEFDDTLKGARPTGNLVETDSGILYGMTPFGGSYNRGVLFEYNIFTNSFQKKLDFDSSSTGAYPYGSLLNVGNGKLFGMTNQGGSSNQGILFEYIIDSNKFIRKFDFNGNNGSEPYYTQLIIICPPSLTVVDTCIFAGDSILLDNRYIKQQGSYIDSNINICGQDSIIITNLFNKYLVATFDTICQKDTFVWRGEKYTSTGIYYDSLFTIYDFDSTFLLNLKVLPKYFLTEAKNICNSQTYKWHNKNLSVSGTYYDSIKTYMGCDSVFALELTVNPTYSFSEQADFCQGGLYNWHGKDYYSGGVYYDSINTYNGCDSIFELTLNQTPVDTAIVKKNDSLFSKASNASYQWLNCNQNQSLAGETRQYFVPTINGDYAVEITQNNCADTSACYYMQVVGIAGPDNNNQIYIYPNPANNNLVMQGKGIIEVSIVNINGKQFINQPTKQEIIEVETTNYPSGLYFVLIHTNKRLVTRKVMISH
jgi:uncharacterized repeat protein (TIGR03803 family)